MGQSRCSQNSLECAGSTALSIRCGYDSTQSGASRRTPKVAMNRFSGLILIFLGAGAVIIGLLIYSGTLSWFGRLPGDIRYQSDNVRVYVPIVSMLIVSLVLSLLFYLLRRFF